MPNNFEKEIFQLARQIEKQKPSKELLHKLKMKEEDAKKWFCCKTSENIFQDFENLLADFEDIKNLKRN